jgi:hypothetical protein
MQANYIHWWETTNKGHRRYAMHYTVLTKSNPWSRALPIRARSARHLQYTNGRHTRNKRVMKRVSNAVMTRECHADVVRMSYRWGASYARHSSGKCDVKRASYARHSSSKCDVKRAYPAHYTRSPTWEARFIAWVTFGQYCSYGVTAFKLVLREHSKTE